MQVAGESENYNVEQEHLNNVFGARLRITALRAGKGPASSGSSTSHRATAGRRRRICAPTTSRTYDITSLTSSHQ
jgi:hypothetical protein